MNPFVNCLFFGICNVLLQMVSCNWEDTDHPVLNVDRHIECWSGLHLFLGSITLIIFFSYFPLAIHLMPKLQQASGGLDIKYNEKVTLASAT